MGEFVDVVRRRRMTRAFDSRPVPDETLAEMVDLASRAPSAGKSQGWHLVVLDGDDTARFWDITLPVMRRGTFKWQRLLDAPLIALPFADPKAYTDRYSEPDKAAPASVRGRGLAGAVLDDRRVDGGDDHAAGRRGPRARCAVLRGVQGRARAAPAPWGATRAGVARCALAIGYPADPTDPISGGGRVRGRVGARHARRRTPTEIIHLGRW
jgi:hypothetical protein